MSMIDLNHWPRRATYDFFLGFEDPWFNLCAEVEVGPTKRWCEERGFSFALACWYAVSLAANHVPALRMRLRPQGVWLHREVRVGATALRPDQSFTYVYYPHAEDFPRFHQAAKLELQARLESQGLEPSEGEDDLLYCTMIPWVRFTAVKHARQGHRLDAVPRIALGRATEEGERLRLPVSLEAHHALVDGLHAGQFFQALEARLTQPEDTYASMTGVS